MLKKIGFIFVFTFFTLFLFSQSFTTLEDFQCTSVTVGKKASKDGSVMTSHSDDSHRSRTDISVEPAKTHPAGSMQTLYKRTTAKPEKNKMPRYENVEVGKIPQVKETYQFLNSAYPCLNEVQLAIGESTFSGRPELRSDNGLIDCPCLCMLLMQRCSTAREAIRTAGELLKEYGWIDAGECLTIADKNEVWHLEIVGPGKGKKGAVWAAQRVPDDHISVNANASRILEIDTKNKDYFMFSDNVFSVAEENNWYDKSQGAFRFAYAYAPESRAMLACRRREWRVFDLLAPSLRLDPNSENYPFSVKPDSLVTLDDMVRVFKDYYEGTEFDMRKNITVTDRDGKTVISPFANPFMKVDELKLHKVNGGWHGLGERAIAVHFTVYATIIQCRDFLPDEVGGVCWFALDNVASSIYIPIYGSVTDLPDTYKTCGRITGFSKDAAWWAFNRLGTITAKRWGDMHKVVDDVWNPLQTSYFQQQKKIEKKALSLLKNEGKSAAINYLTRYTNDCGIEVVEKAWLTGDLIWTTFDGRW
ncbi:MAG TPA: dipeptidase [Bacteroidales bacterium]|jgi:dipeptidase|nr:dipeptidase [Bacteroidales bacterium]